MSDITKASNISVDTLSAMSAKRFTGTSGSILAAGDAVYLDSDGYLYPTNQTAVSGSLCTKFAGLVAKAYASGDAVTVFGSGTIMNYGSAMTPGDYLFVSSNAGKLADAAKSFTLATISGSAVPMSDMPRALVLTATDIQVL